MRALLYVAFTWNIDSKSNSKKKKLQIGLGKKYDEGKTAEETDEIFNELIGSFLYSEKDLSDSFSFLDSNVCF